jgi:hypothetical protein
MVTMAEFLCRPFDYQTMLMTCCTVADCVATGVGFCDFSAV